MIERDLERELIDLGGHLQWPEPHADLAGSVIRTIEASPRMQRSRSRMKTFAVATAVALVVVLAVMVVSPPAREAVADWLGLGGVRIEHGPQPDRIIGRGLALGRATTFQDAQAQVSFDILVPDDPRLGAPDEVYLDDDTPAGDMVALVYAPRSGFPATQGGEVGLLVTEFRADLERSGDFFKKVLGSGTTVERVVVDGDEGLWLEGDPHSFFYRDENGELVQESVRLVANVLLWEQDGLTVRLESALSKKEALAIAATMSSR